MHPFVREMIICVLVFRGGAEVERFLGTVYDYPYREEHENLLPPRLDRFTVCHVKSQPFDARFYAIPTWKNDIRIAENFNHVRIAQIFTNYFSKEREKKQKKANRERRNSTRNI